MNVDDLARQVPPETLYHYTTQSGLIGILTTREIWASKIHYMNDSKEFALALDLVRQELTTRIEVTCSDSELERLKVLLGEVDRVQKVNVCVCSFSESGDSLSQWRGYGDGGAGFSVGFSKAWFVRTIKSLDFSLRPCIYDPVMQSDLVRQLIDSMLATDFSTTPGYMDPDKPGRYVVLPMGGDFAQRLTRLAPLLKDESFSEEKEWRLVSSLVDVYQLRYRPGKSMIVPYYSIPIESEGELKSINEIVVGPTPLLELSADSVSSLLATAGTSPRPDLKTTTIPFRSW